MAILRCVVQPRRRHLPLRTSTIFCMACWAQNSAARLSNARKNGHMFATLRRGTSSWWWPPIPSRVGRKTQRSCCHSCRASDAQCSLLRRTSACGHESSPPWHVVRRTPHLTVVRAVAEPFDTTLVAAPLLADHAFLGVLCANAHRFAADPA